MTTQNSINNLLATTALTGVLQAAQFPATSGDISNSAGSLTMTLPTVNGNVGTFTNATVTVNAKGQVTAASQGSAAFAPMPTAVVTGTTQAMAANTCYVANNASLGTYTLPATFAVGDEFRLMGLGAGGFKLAQNASQLIHFGNQVTTTGTGGSIQNQDPFDTIHLKATVTNTTLSVVGSQGNFTIV